MALILSVVLGFSLALAPVAHAGGKFAAIAIDARTGQILFDSDSNGLRYPASLTKMMTLYIVFQELKAKRIKLSTPLRASARTANMPPSKLGLRKGETITVEQAIKALVVKSANDVAATVGENLGGSESAFAARMTRTARALGMSRTTYRNASGLPNPGQVTTARDQATLGLRLMRDFPQYYPYFRATQFSWKGRVIGTHNNLLKRFAGTDGIKTGYINASGYNLVTSTKRGNKRLVGVVLGGRSGASRNAYMASMLTKVFPKARDGRTVAAAAGTSRGAVDPIVALKSKTKIVASAPQSQPDSAAMAEAANTASQSTEEPEEAEAPKVLEAELAGAMDEPLAEAPAVPADKKLPFQVKKPATQADVDGLAVASLPQEWAVEIGDFKTRKSAADMVAKLKAKDETHLANKSPKTIPVKRNGASVYRLFVSGYDEPSAKRSCAQVEKMGKACAVRSPNG